MALSADMAASLRIPVPLSTVLYSVWIRAGNPPSFPAAGLFKAFRYSKKPFFRFWKNGFYYAIFLELTVAKDLVCGFVHITAAQSDHKLAGL